MSRDIIQKICVCFDEEDKDEVLEMVKKSYGEEIVISSEGKDYYNFEFDDTDFDEEDFKELKEICNYIDLAEYEYCDDGGFIWEKEDDDELQKIVSKKVRQIKKEKGGK